MVETLNLRGLEGFSPEIQTFLRTLEKSFLHTLNTCVPADKQEKEIFQLRDTIEGIGDCGPGISTSFDVRTDSSHRGERP